MSNVEFVGSLLAPYEPQFPIERLVVEVNNIYHAFEAQDYEARHPEIYKQLPPFWREMTRQAMALRSPPAWSILDFGCGSGFAAEQLLRNLPPSSIAQVVCYDPAPEMLRLCEAKISPLFPQAVFCSDLGALPQATEQFNLLATNSLLHHLPDPVRALEQLLPRLTPDAIWLAGHEPSNRFYQNAECLQAYERFRRADAWRMYLSIKTFVRIFKQGIRFRRIAQETVYRGLFGRVPPPSHIDRLVDFHVAHSSEEARSGRGFNVDTMQQQFQGTFDLTWLASYSFMGPFYERDLPRRWARISRRLREKYPRDGANFCAIWTRAPGASGAATGQTDD